MPVSADIRQFMTDSFSAEEFDVLCADHFPTVYDGFGGGQTKGQRIQRLIEYCQHHDEWPALLQVLQRPRQFAQFVEPHPPTPSPVFSGEGEPAASVTNTSGGIDLNANEVSIGGDAVGRDKVVIINGNVYHIHLDAGTDSATLLRAIETGQPSPIVPARPRVENPFYTNGRINDPALFFDREQLVREIRAELQKHCSVSLVGESQIGKSSLLHYLYATCADWLPQADVIFVDLQLVLNETDFCRRVLKLLGASGDTLIELRDAVEEREVVLLLDEVEKLSNRAFTSDLHDLLRALAQEPNFALGVATQRPLDEIFPPGSLTSPFHNIFTRKTLGAFRDEDARAFLAAMLAPTGVTFSPRDIDHLLRDSGSHPAKLQRLAKELFDEYVNM